MLYGIAAANLPPVYALDELESVSRRAEAIGVESIWTVEHMVLRDPQAPPSPLPPDTPLFDPLIALSFIAAHTSRVQLGTGVLILPLRNPLILAKQVASLDALSEGRVILGVGVGYVREEFDAIGVPFETRGARCDEYLSAMRAVWYDAKPAFTGSFVRFSDVQSLPRPVQPYPFRVVVGGRTIPAYTRAVKYAQGWYGYGLTLAEAQARIGALREVARRVPRPDELGALTITVTPAEFPDEALVSQLAELGVDRVNVLLPSVLDARHVDTFFSKLERLIRALGRERPLVGDPAPLPRASPSVSPSLSACLGSALTPRVGWVGEVRGGGFTGVAESLLDPPFGHGVLAVEAFRVNLEQDGDAMTGPLGGLRRRYTTV